MAEQAVVIDFEQARARRTARAGEGWVSKAEIARHMGWSPRTVNRRMRAGMPFNKRFEQSQPRFQVSAVEDWWAGR